jgi:signal recognition particle subunit SEC65
MKRILFLVVVFSLFISCSAQKNSVKQLEDNGSVVKIELLFSSNGETVTKNVGQAYWKTIVQAVKTAEYDNEQYDEVKNPRGYMIKMTEQNYILKIFYTNNIIDEILIWTGANKIKINGKWYILQTEKEELFHILERSNL